MSKINRNENNFFSICFSLFYRFQYRNGEADWISIENQDDTTYCDGIGFQGKKGKKQKINFTKYAFDEGLTSGGGKRKAIGTPMHELMHAIGRKFYY